MEVIENLSDEQLRVRLSQYGFANMPVTDTTRKVLMKKLKRAIEGEKTKGRRETVAVAKFSSDEEPEKVTSRGAKTQSRRATIAAEKLKKVEKPPANGSSSRADTPKKPVSRHSSRASSTAVVQDDSDDDIIEIPVTRRSRTTTPTLGKSDTVRTSYNNKVEVVEESTEDSTMDDDEYFEELPAPRNYSPALQQKTSTYRQSFKTSTSGYKVQGESTTPSFGRASLSTSYNPRGNYKFDTVEDDEPLEINETNTPYLSSFAKRLSTIRAEPLDAGMDKYRGLRDIQPSSSSNYMSTRQSSFNYSAPPAKSIVRKESTLSGFGKVYDRLDRQFNITRALYIVFLIMTIVALYVIFM